VRSTKLSYFAAGAVTAVLLGGGTAVAATGGNFILGRSNAASTTTTLTNSTGTPLALNAKAGTAALRVNNTVKVTNLNADTVDGLHSTSFARTGGRTGSFDASGAAFDSDGDGTNDAIAAFAACPKGTQMTGGGVWNSTATGFTIESAPSTDPASPEGWEVLVAVDPTAPPENPADVIASVTCYNPTGAVAGSYGLAATTVSPKTVTQKTVSPKSRLSADVLHKLALRAEAQK
jgi:hypothetical protein